MPHSFANVVPSGLVLPSQELTALLKSLGISADLLIRKKLPFFEVATELVTAENDDDRHRLIPEAAIAWQAMKRAAREDGILLEIVSAFRDIGCQADIIRDKIARAIPMETILTLSAPPGYSEHHTGRAVDINTPGCEAREAPFAETAAFRWLTRHAARFRFTMSYPVKNDLGFIHEPWHWCFQPL